MRSDMKRLLSFYKLISVIGVCAVIAPLFHASVQMFAPSLAFLLTLVIFPAAVGIGYVCQWLLLGKEERLKKQTVDFNFEQKITLSKKRRLMAVALALLAGLLFGRLCAFPLSALLSAGVKSSLAVGFFMAVCAVSAYVGVKLCRASFNQLLGVRSLIECCAAFAAYGAFGAYIGGLGVFLFFALAVYSLCLLIELNQESVLQTIGESDTCHMTPALFRTGILSTLKVWGRAFVFMLGLLSLFTALTTFVYFSFGIIQYRLVTANEAFSAFEIVFYDIPTRNPVVNFIFFLAGIALIVFGLVLLFGRRRQWGAVWLSSLRGWLVSVLNFVQGFFSRLRYQGKKEELPSVPLTENYTDTVKKLGRPVRRRALSYPSFLRRLKSLTDARERYAYAYRTLIAFMVQKEIGVEEHHTPTEAARIIEQKTNYREIGELTSLFSQMTYAKDRPLDENALRSATDTCCRILEKVIAV